MPRCGCGGQTCGCKITGGSGVTVQGSGTAADPYTVAVDPFSLGLGAAIQVSTSPSIEFTRAGTGATGDPLVISGSVVLRSPDNTRWRLSVTNAGVLSATKI